MTEKRCCSSCGVELDDDNWSLSAKSCHRYACKNCLNKQGRQWCIENKEKRLESGRKCAMHRRRTNGGLPMNENKECSSYLGVHIAERVLRHTFKNVEQMPYGNRGYDFVCGNGYKIDVKSSCIRHTPGKNDWMFNIKHNTTTDYFILIAFDNRDDLTPLYVWMIPGHILNHLTTTGISKSTIGKWDKYRLDIDKVVICCDTIRKENHE